MADAAFFTGGAVLPIFLPKGVERPADILALGERRWDVLALTDRGCAALAAAPETVCRCRTALLPGAWSILAARQLQCEQVVSCGLSPKDSLTVSSICDHRTAVCVQRTITRADGRTIDPQELTLCGISGLPEDFLAAVGLWLLL